MNTLQLIFHIIFYGQIATIIFFWPNLTDWWLNSWWLSKVGLSLAINLHCLQIKFVKVSESLAFILTLKKASERLHGLEDLAFCPGRNLPFPEVFFLSISSFSELLSLEDDSRTFFIFFNFSGLNLGFFLMVWSKLNLIFWQICLFLLFHLELWFH